MIDYNTDKEVKTGRYKNIMFEALNWTCGTMKVWNGYIYIPLESLNKVLKEKILKSEQTKYSWEWERLEEIDLLSDCVHWGFTYAKRQDDGRHKMIVLGWDYNHLHDNFDDYSFEYILKDVKRVIDKLQEYLKHED